MASENYAPLKMQFHHPSSVQAYDNTSLFTGFSFPLPPAKLKKTTSLINKGMHYRYTNSQEQGNQVRECTRKGRCSNYVDHAHLPLERRFLPQIHWRYDFKSDL